jgi:Mg2+/citrate symporter
MDSRPPQPVRRKRRAVDWPTAILIIIVGTCASYVYWRDGTAKFLEVVWSDTDLFISMLPKVLAGCLTAAFLAILLPRETINRWVGADSGFKGILIATFAGVILPGGPFTRSSPWAPISLRP